MCVSAAGLTGLPLSSLRGSNGWYFGGVELADWGFELLDVVGLLSAMSGADRRAW